ncbi:MAG: hypothetical protein V4721_12470 [Bacteroidota bacterium]
MPKLKDLYAIECRYLDRENNETRLYRMRGLTWGQLRVFRETVFTTGLFVGKLDNAAFGDGFIIPPWDVLKIYVYMMKEKIQEPSADELR